MTQAYPLAWPDGWPRTTASWRTYAGRKFGLITLHAAVSGLYDELRLLSAESIVVSTNVEPRLDGMPKSGQREPSDPGAAVYFRLNDKPMVMAQDTYCEIASNLRSLALAVHHLRGLERHGGGHMMERAFAGFTALPPPSGHSEPLVDWRTELGPLPDGLGSADLLILSEARYRTKAKEAHADIGGSDEKMIRLNSAIAQARQELAGHAG